MMRMFCETYHPWCEGLVMEKGYAEKRNRVGAALAGREDPALARKHRTGGRAMECRARWLCRTHWSTCSPEEVFPCLKKCRFLFTHRVNYCMPSKLSLSAPRPLAGNDLGVRQRNQRGQKNLPSLALRIRQSSQVPDVCDKTPAPSIHTARQAIPGEIPERPM